MGRFSLCRRLGVVPLQLFAFQAVYAVASHVEGGTPIGSAFPPPYLLLWAGSIVAAGLALTVIFPLHRPPGLPKDARQARVLARPAPPITPACRTGYASA